jgi:hypothetical protein
MTIRGYGIIAILISMIASIVLANTIDMTGYELGSLFNLIIPPIIGGITLIVFLLVCWISKEGIIRLIVLILLCSYCIYAGLAFHLDKDYLHILPV